MKLLESFIAEDVGFVVDGDGVKWTESVRRGEGEEPFRIMLLTRRDGLAVMVDRRTGACDLTFNGQSLLDGGVPDFWIKQTPNGVVAITRSELDNVFFPPDDLRTEVVAYVDSEYAEPRGE